MKASGSRFWKTHYPFGGREYRFHEDQLTANWWANLCRRDDEQRVKHEERLRDERYGAYLSEVA